MGLNGVLLNEGLCKVGLNGVLLNGALCKVGLNGVKWGFVKSGFM